MSSRVAVKKEKNVRNERSISESILLLFPLFLIVFILPFIVKMHEYSSGLNVYDWFTYGDTAYDFFLYYKQWFFVGICVLMVLIIIGRAIFDKKTLKLDKIFIPIGIYALLALISTLCSKYRSFGIKGSFEQFENVICLLGYVLVAYYIFIVIQSQYELQLMVKALAIGLLLLNTLGMLQSIGIDPLTTNFGKSLIIQSGMDPNNLSLAFGKGRSYATLYNPNYVGVVSLMAVSLFSVLLITSKKVSEYILYYLVILTASFSMFGAQFKAGLVYLIVIVVFMIIFLHKELKQRWLTIVSVVATMLVAFIVTNSYSDGAYTDAINNALEQVAVNPELTAMDSLADGVYLKYQGNGLKIVIDQEHNLAIYDDNGNTLAYSDAREYDGGMEYMINDMKFTNIDIGVCDLDSDNGFDFYVLIDENYYIFQYDDASETYLYYNRYGKYSPIVTAESVIFNGHERFASGRGYIWSRSLPLLKKYFFLGSGADSFVQAFPQYDYVGMNNFGFGSELITKPHCLYIQIGVQTGVISLLCYLCFFLIYFIQSVMLYIKNDFKSPAAVMGFGLFIGVLAYLLGGVSNDSMVCVTPIFWVMVGLGLVSNQMVKKAQ